ncbi:hypothetical protein [Mesorhizobium sp. RIZ17]|uniref:hypothetical protein n=1 Tax=Mesorhizobium sp. RIZ17 TaxID=3132743 RepID=UPI003DA90B72
MRAISLSRFGSRCSTTTNAQPLSAGIASKKLLKASMPPAEAPMPTTGIALSETLSAASCMAASPGFAFRSRRERFPGLSGRFAMGALTMRLHHITTIATFPKKRVKRYRGRHLSHQDH